MLAAIREQGPLKSFEKHSAFASALLIGWSDFEIPNLSTPQPQLLKMVV